MCFPAVPKVAPQVLPPPPPPPPPAQPKTIAPPTPPPAPAAPPVSATPGAQATGLESAQLKTGGSTVESKRRAREGASRLKKKVPTKRTSTKVPDTKGTGQGLSYSGNISGSGSSLNINK